MQQKSKVSITISIAAVVGIIIILHYIGFLLPIEQVLRHIINKVAQPLYKVYTEEQSGEEKDQILAAQKKLEEISLQLTQLTLEKELLQEENIELRKQLQFFASSSFSYVGAEIIGKNVDPIANTIILNRGSEAGIAVGNPVIVQDGILIGKIARVEEGISIVRLLQDGQSKVAVTIRNQEKTIGLIEGGYGIGVQMNFIPQNEIVTIGDAIITSGLEAGIPRGLYVGTIAEVQKEAYQPFQEAVVTPAIMTQTVHVVSVITKTMQ